MAVTESACRNMKAKQAFICIGCTGPTLIRGGGDFMVQMATETEPGAVPQATPEAFQPLSQKRPGVWVDFTGHEDLLKRFTTAVAERGMEPGASALDLIYLFDAGLLVLREEL